MNRALLMSTDREWVQASGIETMLARLGFTVSTEPEKALAEPRRVRLVVEHRLSVEFGIASMPTGIFPLPAETLRFAVVPHQAQVGEALPGFHATLSLPIDECAFVDALATCRYIAISAHERDSLHTRIGELACDDQAVARQLVRLLIDTNASTLAALRDAFSTRSWDAVGRGVHRMAGSARMLDCPGLLALLSRLEGAARAHQVELARPLLQVIVNTIDSLGASLQKLLDAASTF